MRERRFGLFLTYIVNAILESADDSRRCLTQSKTARLVCTSIYQHRPLEGAVAQLGERMTGSPQPTVLLIINK